MFVCIVYICTDDRDNRNESPLDVALKSNEIEIAHYLISRSGGGGKQVAKLLCGACETGEFDVVKDLIEKYKVDPKGKYTSVCFVLRNLLQ